MNLLQMQTAQVLSEVAEPEQIMVVPVHALHVLYKYMKFLQFNS